MIAASMIRTGYWEHQGQEPRALDIGKPLGTVGTDGVKYRPIASFIAQQNNDSRGVGGVLSGR